MKMFRVVYRFGPRDLWSEDWIVEDDLADEISEKLRLGAEIKINHYIIK